MYTNTLLKMANILTEQYNTIFKHAGNVGDSREKAVIDYLIKANADKYGFSKGEVFDKNDKSSGEVDVSSTPFLNKL